MIHTCMHRRRELLAALARSCEGVCGAMSFFVLNKTENQVLLHKYTSIKRKDAA